MSAPAWSPARAGLLNRLYAPSHQPETYDTALALLADAEALGLGTGWVAQHHFGSETGRLPSPLLLLAKASQTTQRIRLGTAVIVLPLEPVLRLAEDAGLLDALSGGRLELGLGSGFDGPSFTALGQDAADRGLAYAERIVHLIRVLSGEPLTADPDSARLWPPSPGLRQRLWESSSAVASVAERGNGLLTAPRAPGQEESEALVRRYRETWRRLGRTDAPRVTLVRGIFPGTDAASVEAEVGPDILRYLESRGAPAIPSDLPEYLRRLGVAWGSPAQIVDQLAGALAGVDQIVAQVQTFSTTRAQATRRLQLFAEQVLPALPAVQITHPEYA